jgi:FMN hydrolase / 5-amino-6-(5-phospho-D-ribitylamino)uracil phosphatase
VARALAGGRVLLLDVLGTVVYEPFFVEVPRFLGLSLEELLAAKHPTAWAEFERGAIDEAELERRFFRDGRAYDHAGMRACMEAAYRFVDGMEPLLADLSAAGVPMHALSNYPDWYLLIERRLALSRFLEWSFVSCRTGHRKPAPEAFRGPLAQLGVAPAQAVFVDDREENCAAARALGIDALHFTGADALRAALVERGMLPS